MTQGKMANREKLENLLALWFSPQTRKLWFQSTAEFDNTLRRDFEAVYLQAKAGELDDLAQQNQLALALVILLDQVPLNIYRNDASRYTTEQQALEIARIVIDRGGDAGFSNDEKAFLYMPYMHSEKLEHQEEAIRLFEQAGLSDNAKFARHHYGIIERFGRFPHRNEHLGRTSTEEEMLWLNSEEGFSA